MAPAWLAKLRAQSKVWPPARPEPPRGKAPAVTLHRRSGPAFVPFRAWAPSRGSPAQRQRAETQGRTAAQEWHERLVAETSVHLDADIEPQTADPGEAQLRAVAAPKLLALIPPSQYADILGTSDQALAADGPGGRRSKA